MGSSSSTPVRSSSKKPSTSAPSKSSKPKKKARPHHLRYDSTPTFGYTDHGVPGPTVGNPHQDYVSAWKKATDLCNAGEIAIGDIIEIKRRLYSHYVVYVGWEDERPMIIHLAVNSACLEEKFSSDSSSSSTETTLTKVLLTDLIKEAKGNDCRIKNRVEDQQYHYRPREIVNRAKSKLGDARYNPFTYNCEHFAMWCRFGYLYSTQAIEARSHLRYDSSPTFGYTDNGMPGPTVGIPHQDYVSAWKQATDLCNTGEIAIGDIIEIKRLLYSHYVVYVGWKDERPMIIHLAVNSAYLEEKFLSDSRSSSTKTTLTKVLLTDLIKEANGDKCRIKNRVEDQQYHYRPREIVNRAMSKLGDSRYNPFTYNCEHFAMWCRFGCVYSTQAQKALKKVNNAIEKVCRDPLGSVLEAPSAFADWYVRTIFKNKPRRAIALNSS